MDNENIEVDFKKELEYDYNKYLSEIENKKKEIESITKEITNIKEPILQYLSQKTSPKRPFHKHE